VPPPGEGPAAFFNAIVFGLVGVWGIAFLILDILAFQKKIWALYIGLAVILLSVLISLISFPICGIVLIVIGLIQALQVQRVLGWANQLRAAGIPLTTLPQDLELALSHPIDT
jgi:hypothetical protein